MALLADRTLVDIKPLKGRNDWRLRVGDYRVIFIIDNENKVYFVTKIGPRGAERTTTGGLPVPMAIALGKVEAIAQIANLSDD
ncbi:MAG: type II toxin-antitoxin system RelE/ParE family toxin [Microcoleus sp. SU_5_3]|nr:type II toxin-antitoxin system RelE/ParE family toxin [Microcoleus sp. SU_5_3]